MKSMFDLAYLILHSDQNLAEFCKAPDFEIRALTARRQSKYRIKLVVVIRLEKFESFEPDSDL